MPSLVCSAEKCIYNKNELCSKGDIKVAGNDATKPQDTCCSSFEERRGDNVTNAVGTGCCKIDVDCEACQCTFNKNYKCNADKIGIAGSNACKCEQTECGSFEQK